MWLEVHSMPISPITTNLNSFVLNDSYMMLVDLLCMFRKYTKGKTEAICKGNLSLIGTSSQTTVIEASS